jgi:hypothetical protein
MKLAPYPEGVSPLKHASLRRPVSSRITLADTEFWTHSPYYVAYSIGRTPSVVFGVLGRCAPGLISSMH